MGKGKHYPRVLPTGERDRVYGICPGDRIQRPRSPIFVVDMAICKLTSGIYELVGHFEESGSRRTYVVSMYEDISDWGWER